MRLPDINSLKQYKETELIDTLKIKDVEPLSRHINLLTDKDKTKALIATEKQYIRPSLEYKAYIKYLKEYMDMTKCSFFDNVKASKRVKIEIHHSPFSLYDITSVVAEKQMHENGEFNYFKIAEEVLKLHYQCKVGLIPLSTTVHSLVHNGELFIPLDAPRGDFVSFIKEYDRYISNDLMSNLEQMLILSKQVQNLSLLNTKYTYMEVDGFTLPKIIE